MFGSKSILSKCKNLTIECKDSKIECKNKVKYLGSFLDSDMSGISMFEHSRNKINSSLKFLYCKKRFLSENDRNMLSTALIQPWLDNACNSLYHGLTKVNKHKLQISLNKTIQFVLSHYDNLNWINVENRVNYLGLCTLHKIVHSKNQNYMADLFDFKQSHHYETRHNYMPVPIPQVKSYGKGTFAYNIAKQWFILPKKYKTTKIKNFQKTIETIPSRKFQKSRGKSI